MKIECPTCPVCGAAAVTYLGGTWPRQAWCSNANCNVVCWDATRTVDENLAAFGIV